MLALIIGSCAQIKTPTGGQRDIVGPKITESYPGHLETNYKGKSVAITFDELVTLTDANNNVVITPPLKNKPNIYLKGGQSLIIEFNDTLQKNTTYTLNLGEAISDYTESNPLDSALLVFSTGHFIDSLSFSGEVKHSKTDQLCIDCKVMLYETFEDSTAYKDKPYYFSKTNEQGKFNFEYLKEGAYEIIALQDISKNFLFDPGEDQIGFLNEKISVSQALLDSIVKLSVFKEIPETQQLSSFKMNSDQNLNLIFDLPVQKLAIDKDSIDITDSYFIPIYDDDRDSISLWIKDIPEKNTEWKLTIKDNDTVLEKISVFFSENMLEAYILSPQKNGSTKIGVTDSITIKTATPIASFDVNKMVVNRDSTAIPFEVIKSDDFSLKLNFLKEESKFYTLRMDSAAIIDIYNQASDSTFHNYAAQENAYFGHVKFSFDIDTVDRIGYLYDTQGNLIRTQKINEDGILSFRDLYPGMYSLMILYDENGDGKWNTGSYLKKINAEKMKRYQGEINVRSNWALELN